MKYVYYLLCLVGIIFWSSCRQDFETVASSGNLEFSKDTVYLDTIFTNIGSSTYNLMVYNRSDEDITIPTIQLAQGENSKYRLSVDGLPGKTFENIDILAKDSIFIFIETTADIQEFTTTETQFLYTDAIEFDSGSNMQKVELVTLVQDAIFLYPEKFPDGSTETLSFGFDEEGNEILVEGFFLDDSELHFTNEKPYVIYNFATVPPNKTLIIDPGARIHFHRNSGLIVANQGSLQVNGELSTDQEALENEVIFEGDRLEPSFSDVPGQWLALWFTQGSTNNKISYATIKNAEVGILIDSNDGTANPTLTIDNSKIYNSLNAGMIARTSFVEAENTVIGSGGQVSLNLSLGGRYRFNNCTFANYFIQNSRQLPAVLIENQFETGGDPLFEDLVEATFQNCIIYGNENIELGFNKNDNAAFNFKFENCLIRFNDFNDDYEGIPEYDFSDTSLYEDVIINEDPNFKAHFDNEFIIGEESAANGIGNPATTTINDILGETRGSQPDAGAYESVVFE
ncbi:hypothetical protein [Mesonia sp. K7]|uniref:hypothetical protein n=1 Tax=Mesonia sp. K7 TaxID=2218606 RepID=UPI000DA98AC0|nr:hypothetical protein [Mesonia sp. K7]PZD79592.1 hypothetical protein DNG35_00880 [Mesonia sp. K7]